MKLWRNPEEAIHFLEYGLLGFFLFKALSNHIRNKSIYLTATLFALSIGILDEALQWVIPLRIWSFRDVGLNVLSGGLFKLAIWQVVKPKIISGKANWKSFKIFTSIFASCLILLGLCASNTPQRVFRYTNKIPWLSYLQKEEPMSEFGYKHKDPDIGVFYSRFSPKSIKKIDNLRGHLCAQILNKSVNKNYQQFIREYSATTDPFMHELRVHIYRRDALFNKGKSTSNLNKKKNSYFIAYKENLILEKYFSKSIENSVYRWNKDTLREIEVLIDKSKHYESPVSANVFTTFSEKAMWIAIIGVISFLVLVNFVFHLRKR
ncbi:MAG: VanZ family protein [Candidatus Aminicenantes bacterium]|nr:MAG: VanZ family protein [Candidatus Aminicenantes bacterium]